MVSLVDDGKLTIVLESTQEAGRPRWRFRFDRVPVYQSILEEYRLELWNRWRTQDSGIGWTRVIPESPWIEGLLLKEELLKLHFNSLTHYQISTGDDVIDIVSPDKPMISSVAPGQSDTLIL